jgi:hypothetical protein
MPALRLLVPSAAMALAVAGVLYGVACELLAFANRQPGLPHYSLMLRGEELTERGRAFHYRGRRAWVVGFAAFVIASVMVPG